MKDRRTRTEITFTCRILDSQRLPIGLTSAVPWRRPPAANPPSCCINAHVRRPLSSRSSCTSRLPQIDISAAIEYYMRQRIQCETIPSPGTVYAFTSLSTSPPALSLERLLPGRQVQSARPSEATPVPCDNVAFRVRAVFNLPLMSSCPRVALLMNVVIPTVAEMRSLHCVGGDCYIRTHPPTSCFEYSDNS